MYVRGFIKWASGVESGDKKGVRECVKQTLEQDSEAENEDITFVSHDKGSDKTVMPEVNMN